MDKQSISADIRQIVEETNPIPPSIVTAEARRSVEVTLYRLPRLCEELERAGAEEAPLVSGEIERIKLALESISHDPYYLLIPAKYFQGAKERTAAALCACDKATVWRNRIRLLDVLALCLLGVSAWDRTRNW